MAVIWGVPYLLIRVAVRDMSPATLVFLRTAPAALLLVPVALRGGGLSSLRGRWPAVVAYTVAELAVPWVLLSSAETRIPSALASLLVATVPIVGAVLARVSGGAEPLGGRRSAGLIVGLAGVGVLVGVDLRQLSGVAVAEVLLTAVGYAAGPLIVARRLSDVPPVPVVAASLALTALAYAPWGLSHPPRHLAAGPVAAVACLAVVCTALAFVLFFALIAEVGPERATVITYLNPAVALLLGVVALGEPFTLGIALGFPMVLAGSALATGRVGGRPARPVAVTV